jgi:hypothetical protein
VVEEAESTIVCGPPGSPRLDDGHVTLTIEAGQQRSTSDRSTE